MTVFKAAFKKNKVYKPIYGNPPLGGFALQPDSGHPIFWEPCREHFSVQFTENCKGFYFCHSFGKSDDVANFISKFENIVQINQKQEFSTFRKTCRRNIIWIEPSVFWLKCKMKRSLFTILARCGMNYFTENDNFDDVLFGNYKENIYLKDTKSAFLRFMFGFTDWNNIDVTNKNNQDERHGWREEFYNLDEKKARLMLACPKNSTKQTNLIGFDSLWSG